MRAAAQHLTQQPQATGQTTAHVNAIIQLHTGMTKIDLLRRLAQHGTVGQLAAEHLHTAAQHLRHTETQLRQTIRQAISDLTQASAYLDLTARSTTRESCNATANGWISSPLASATPTPG
ncbi:hypothetical protein ACOZ38_37835 [Sphaerisporangium viridialbum]|uniref:hypothetical protein n=1 Tax=Sphaerisporangium viridialbum TaxID=46189 RepID=UPI003C77B477